MRKLIQNLVIICRAAAKTQGSGNAITKEQYYYEYNSRP